MNTASATCRLQIAFLTGRSEPASSALSPVQTEFLQQLAAPGRRLVPCNFPYASPTPPFAPTPILRASVRNLRDYLTARRAAFAACHAKAVRALLDAAPHTVLLAGSCGLELLAGLRLPAEAFARVSVFAYGAVARRKPPCRTLLVQGHGDWLSRWFSPTPDYRVRAGHMSYLHAPEVAVLCATFVAEVERAVLGAGVTPASATP